MISAVALAPIVGIALACAALGVTRATYYRAQLTPCQPRALERRRSEWALNEAEQQDILALLHAPAYADKSPRSVGETRGRRNQLTHPVYAKPELLAERPREPWSWDITKLKGPAKWTCFHLYVILDVFSRYVVGWMLAPQESAVLAHELIAATCDREGIEPGQLTLHADRGTSMRSKPVALLLADLGITKSHSRPHVSDDNPYSESQFKTLKYQPDFPARFESIEHARAFYQTFFTWYNHEHRHSGIGFMTPAAIHSGHAHQLYGARQNVLDDAFRQNPKRFTQRHPVPPPLPTAAGINLSKQPSNAAASARRSTLNCSQPVSQSA
jgi:putative transposase